MVESGIYQSSAIGVKTFPNLGGLKTGAVFREDSNKKSIWTDLLQGIAYTANV